MLSPRIPLFLALALTTLAPASASAQQLRFTATAPGGIVGTGNTLGLSKATDLNGPGIRDSIGTFISLDPQSLDNNPLNAGNPWPMGTTNDWTKNGSSAELALPEGDVLYAELLWGGSYQYGDDVSAFLESSVTLRSGATSIQVKPDPVTALTISEQSASNFAVRYYMRSSEVTAFVKQVGAGIYEVVGVPATQTTAINSLSAAGWTLVVAYRDEGGSTRNLSVFVGGSFVDEDTQQDYGVSGFCTPPAGEVQGSVIVSAIEGDANLPGDQLRIAPTAAGPFVGLSGPNNPANNFFCSQLNGAAGDLDTKGTFGAVNQDGFGEKNVIGGRQGWDVTTVPLSSLDGQLKNSQKSATIRTITTGDSYVPILAAFAIDVNSPDFTGAASMLDAPAEVALGETFTFSATLDNGGDVAAQGIDFVLPLEAGLKLVKFSTDGQAGDINGAPVDTAGLAAGVDVGDLPAGQSRKVALDLEVVGPPAVVSFYLTAKWAYGFEVCANAPLQPESFSRSKSINFNGQSMSASASASGTGSASGASASAGSGGVGGSGDATGAGGAGNGSGVGGSEDPGGDGSCSCSMPGSGAEGPAVGALIGLLGLALLSRGRRGQR